MTRWRSSSNGTLQRLAGRILIQPHMDFSVSIEKRGERFIPNLPRKHSENPGVRLRVPGAAYLHSADLSPIENVWALVEHRLWTCHEWHDLRSFKDALCAAWREVTGDTALLQKLVGSFEKRRQACIEAGGCKIRY